MGKIIETKIDKWDGGIVNDPRDPSTNVCRTITGFDILTNSRKMMPFRQSKSGDDGAATSKKQNFCVALRTGTIYSLYALGVKSGLTTAEVLYKNLTTGATTDLDDDDWAATDNYRAAWEGEGALATNFNLFVYYRYTIVANSRIFGASGGTRIWSYDPAGIQLFDDVGHNLTYTNIAQGLVHSKDDILYIPYDNKIAKNNQGSWTDAALTLPSYLFITSICEYGNYLAIACAPLSGVGNSIVYLWDRDSSLATLSDSIDWGEGTLKVLEDIDGLLVGISFSRNITMTNYSRFNERAIFRYLSVSNAIKFKEILFDRVHPTVQACTTGIWSAKQKIDNRLYFMMSGVLNNRIIEGVWSIGRSSPNSQMVLVHERTPNNDTVIPWATSTGLKNFYILGDYMFISYESGGDYALSKTDDGETYATSIWESKKYDGSQKYADVDASIVKSLKGIAVMTEYLPIGGQVVVKYKIDNETSWSSAILTHTTDGELTASITTGLPKEYHEIEFRLESINGAEITGLTFKEELIGKRTYD